MTDEGDTAMPLVSCLCVTRGTPDRLPMLTRAIGDYAAQSHAARELVIVLDPRRADPAPLRKMVAALGRDDVRLVLPDGPATLGGLRNRSVAAAGGAVICQWDDDDRHHPDRIAAQLAAMSAAEAEACVLAEIVAYRPAGSALRWLNWAATPAGGHPGTLMAHRAALPPYPEMGEEADPDEDLRVLRALDGAGRVHRLGGVPWLYVYVAHGANVWPDAHHAMLAETLAISAGLLRRREAALRVGLAPFGLQGASIEGPNGPAFVL